MDLYLLLKLSDIWLHYNISILALKSKQIQIRARLKWYKKGQAYR